MKLKVTKKMIMAGKCNNPQKCAVALAVQNQLRKWKKNTEVRVDSSYISTHYGFSKIIAGLYEFVTAFDKCDLGDGNIKKNKQKLKPVTLEVPSSLFGG